MAGGVILGIDPGIKGALAFLHPSNRVETFPMPVLKMAKGHNYDERALARLIDAHSREIEFALLERQGPRPTDSGPSAFKVGVGFGVLRMVLAASFIPYALVSPQSWRRFLGVDKGKDGSRALASQLFPEASDRWRLVKDDGHAEATLLAYYGRSHPVRQEAA